MVKKLKDKVTFVIGGCRSGKSGWALERADEIQGNRKIYVATSVPTDPEMQARVSSHQAERGENWLTVEEPLNIHETIANCSKTADVILIDCLTLWVSNLMADSRDEIQIKESADLLIKALDACRCPVFLVSNEVGMGIVPENALARKFRDLAGFVNQQVAKAADRVVMTVAGIAVTIKPERG